MPQEQSDKFNADKLQSASQSSAKMQSADTELTKELITELIMITPFDKDIASLSDDEQFVMLQGCVLCQITRDLENNSARNKPEWKECKAAFGVKLSVFTQDVVADDVAAAMLGSAPVVLVRSESGALLQLLDTKALAACNGRVADMRGRLLFRAASNGLAFPTT